MQKNYCLLIYCCSILILIVLTLSQEAVSYHNGAPPGRSGDPFNSYRTCGDPGGCHDLNVTFKNDLISTNIPPYGYFPDSIYTITTEISHVTRNTFGFQLSPQNLNGELLGTLINTDTQTQVINNNRYITHTEFGIQGENNSKSWTFNWQAPQTGSGSVTFFAAFNAADGDGTPEGDMIFTGTLLVYEAGTNFIDKNILYPEFEIFPNPVKNTLHIHLPQTICNKINVNLINYTGQIVYQNSQTTNKKLITVNIKENKIKKGLYILKLSLCEKEKIKSVIVL